MGNVTQIAEVDPFAGLDPQVLYGTGEVFFEDLETGLDVSAGDRTRCPGWYRRLGPAGEDVDQGH